MKKLLFLILVLGSIQLKAQNSGKDEIGNWLMFFGNSKLSDKYSLHTEAQLRLYEPFSNFNQFLLRAGLNYHINKYSLISGGYGYIPTETFDKELSVTRSVEHRIWEQFILTNSIGRVFFEHRYRVEQRWISTVADNRYLNRLRYRLLVNIPLNNSEMIDNTVFVSLYDEVFLNVNDTPFDQNRLYAALGYKLNKKVSMQAGYLRHRLGAYNFNRLQLGLFFNTDLSKTSSGNQ